MARPAAQTNIVARLIGQWLSERLRQPIVIENRTGAGGNIATGAVEGRWLLRRYRRGRYSTLPLGIADDSREADVSVVRDFETGGGLISEGLWRIWVRC